MDFPITAKILKEVITRNLDYLSTHTSNLSELCLKLITCEIITVSEKEEIWNTTKSESQKAEKVYTALLQNGNVDLYQLLRKCLLETGRGNRDTADLIQSKCEGALDLTLTPKNEREGNHSKHGDPNKSNSRPNEKGQQIRIKQGQPVNGESTHKPMSTNKPVHPTNNESIAEKLKTTRKSNTKLSDQISDGVSNKQIQSKVKNQQVKLKTEQPCKSVTTNNISRTNSPSENISNPSKLDHQLPSNTEMTSVTWKEFQRNRMSVHKNDVNNIAHFLSQDLFFWSEREKFAAALKVDGISSTWPDNKKVDYFRDVIGKWISANGTNAKVATLLYVLRNNNGRQVHKTLLDHVFRKYLTGNGV